MTCLKKQGVAMKIKVLTDKESLGRAAADHATRVSSASDPRSGKCSHRRGDRVSQFEFLDALTSEPEIDWAASRFFTSTNTSAFLHSPASFRKYLFERLIHKTGITRSTSWMATVTLRAASDK